MLQTQGSFTWTNSPVPQGTSGWASPPQELAVRGWAYNVWNVTNTQDTRYTFELQGEDQRIYKLDMTLVEYWEGKKGRDKKHHSHIQITF